MTRQKSGGARQHAWDALAARAWPSMPALAAHIGCDTKSIQPYVNALMTRGYVVRGADGLTLALNTGARAPSWAAAANSFRDWNIDPAMTGAQLQALIRATGLSDSAWLAVHGMHVASATRLRQMMAGQRPVSELVAAAARQISN